MQNVFNYLSVYRAPHVRAEAVVAALGEGEWVRTKFNNPTSDLLAVAFRKETEHAASEYIPHDLVGVGLLGLVDEAYNDPDGDAAEAFEHLFMLDFDSTLTVPRLAKLRGVTGVQNWTLVYVAGEEQMEVDSEVDDGPLTRFLHAGWLAVAPAPDGCYIANMVTDPFLFAVNQQLVTHRPDDAAAYLHDGTKTLLQVLLQACAQSTELVHVQSTVGYVGRDSYVDADVQAMMYNLSFLQNGTTYTMGATRQQFGVTVQRGYRDLRVHWPMLTQSSPDLYVPAKMVLGFPFEFDLEAWEPILLDAYDTLVEQTGGGPDADNAEFSDVVDEVLSTIEDEFDLGPYYVLALDVVDLEVMRGIPVAESRDGPDASKWLITTALQSVVGAGGTYTLLNRLATEPLVGSLQTAFATAAPDWYRDPRYNHTIPHDAAPFTVTIAFEKTEPAHCVVDPRVVPPYIGLHVLPRIFEINGMSNVNDEGLVLLGEVEHETVE